MSDGPQLFLIRHGTTDMAGTLCGHADPPLNAAGRCEARAVVGLLRQCNIRQLYVSDLLRSIQTAEYLTDSLSIPMIVMPELREIAFGEWEGRRWSDLKRTEVVSDLKSFESSSDVIAPGGEGFLAFQERTAAALRHIASCSGRHSTAVVTHMGVIRVAMRYLAMVDDADLPRPIHPCGVYRFVVRNSALTYIEEILAAKDGLQPAQHE